MIMFFDKYAFHLFAVLLVLMVIVAAWVQLPNEHLKTYEAPAGLQSLHLTLSGERARDIVDSWGDKKEHAVESLKRDFVLILVYASFLFSIVYRQRAHLPRWTRYGLAGIAVAAGCDVMENILTWLYLNGAGIPILIITVLAWIKMGLLTAVSLYSLITRRVTIVSLLNALYLYAAGIIAVVLIYFLLIKLTQGQDVLMQVAEWKGPRRATTLCVLACVIFFWYTSRIVGYAKRYKHPGVIQIRLEEHFPRLVAINVLIALQAAVFALPTITGLRALEVLAFVIGQNMLYFILHQMLTQQKHRVLNLVLLLVASAWYVWFAIKAGLRGNTVHMEWLPYYALLIFLFQVVLVYIFVFRHEKVAKKITTESTGGYLKILGFKIVEVPAGIAGAEQFYFNILNGVAIVGLLAYVIPFFSLYMADVMGPLAYALLAFGILVGISNLLTFLTIRTGANIFFLLLLWAIAIGLFYDHYEVRMNRLESNGGDKRSGFAQYLYDWVHHPERQEKILNSDPGTFVTYVVIADGGASRSGYWVASVLAALQDSTINSPSDSTGKKDIFSQHLLCLAGASGGSVGTATFYSLLKNLDNKKGVYQDQAKHLLRQDFLTPVLTRWLGTDILAHIIPHPLEDRAGILERAIERFARDSMQTRIDAPFENEIDVSGKLPMLFINTTYMQEGAPAVVSSVRLQEFSKRLDVIAEVNKQNLEMNYSTAVILGARFPYVSPAGRIGKKHFVDGGYFDNTGAGVVHEMLIELDSIKRAQESIDSLYFDQYLSKLKFRLLYLSNYSSQQSDTADVHPLTNDFLAPVLTVLGTYSSQTEVNNERLVSYLRSMSPRGDTVEVNLYSRDEKEDFPMNWVISEYNLDRMDQRVDSVRRKEFKTVLRRSKP